MQQMYSTSADRIVSLNELKCNIVLKSFVLFISLAYTFFNIEHSSGFIRMVQQLPKLSTYFIDAFSRNNNNKSYVYFGKSQQSDTVDCKYSLFPEINRDTISIESRGGNELDYDVIIECPRVALSPFTNVYFRRPFSRTIFVHTSQYNGKKLKSNIEVSSGQVYIHFTEFELITGDATFRYYKNEKRLEIALYFNSSIFTIRIEEYVFHNPNVVIHIFNKYKHLVRPRILESTDNNETMPIEIEIFELFAFDFSQSSLPSTVDTYNLDIIERTKKEIKVLTTLKLADEQDFIIGSNLYDVIHCGQKCVAVKGRGGHDVYIVSKLNDSTKTTTIFNYAPDNILDFVIVDNLVTFDITTEDYDISIESSSGKIVVDDFLKSQNHQHISFLVLDLSNNNEEYIQYMPLHDVGRLVLFIHSTPTRSIFSLQSNFQQSEIVIDAKIQDLEMYTDRNNLVILRVNATNPLTITLQDFASNPEKWRNIKWYLYNDGFPSHHQTLLSGNFSEYTKKMREDYDRTFREHKHDFSNSTYITHNASHRIGLLKITNVLPTSLNIIFTDGINLRIQDSESNNFIEIKNWALNELYRISIIEFSDPLEPIKIYHFDRFGIEDLSKMQTLFKKASENVIKQVKNYYTPLTSVGVKCIVSLNSFSLNVQNYECLLFRTLSEQIKYVNDYCSDSVLRLFQNKSTFYSVRNVQIQLKNDLILNGYTDETLTFCDRFLNNISNSDYMPPYDVAILNKLLFNVTTLDEIKFLVETGAQLKAYSNDRFNRTLMHWAAMNGHKDIVEYIVEQGMNINVFDANNDTALDCALIKINEICGNANDHEKNCFNKNENLLNTIEYLLYKTDGMTNDALFTRFYNILNSVYLSFERHYPNIYNYFSNHLFKMYDSF